MTEDLDLNSQVKRLISTLPKERQGVELEKLSVKRRIYFGD